MSSHSHVACSSKPDQAGSELQDSIPKAGLPGHVVDNLIPPEYFDPKGTASSATRANPDIKRAREREKYKNIFPRVHIYHPARSSRANRHSPSTREMRGSLFEIKTVLLNNSRAGRGCLCIYIERKREKHNRALRFLAVPFFLFRCKKSIGRFGPCKWFLRISGKYVCS